MLNRCYMYKDEESIDHMLSSKASILWWLYFFFSIWCGLGEALQ